MGCRTAHASVYDGLRHFLFVVPLLAVLAGRVGRLLLVRASGGVDGAIAAVLLAGAGALTSRT